VIQFAGIFGRPVEKLVHVAPPSVERNTLFPPEYPEKVTYTVLGSFGATATRVIAALPTGSVPVMVVQDVPALVVLNKPVARAT